MYLNSDGNAFWQQTRAGHEKRRSRQSASQAAADGPRSGKLPPVRLGDTRSESPASNALKLIGESKYVRYDAFDRRGSTYDASQTHRQVVTILVSGAPLEAGMQVLDVATGTGAVALAAAEVVGPQGSVVGIDVSDGMLAEARQKVSAAGLQTVNFVQADAEQVDLPVESFDFVFCGSGLVMMRHSPARWPVGADGSSLGVISHSMFTQSRSGLSQVIAELAAVHGLVLPYDNVADTPAKCGQLLENAGFVTEEINTEVISDDFVEIADAVSFLDERLDHPAWRALKEAPEIARDAVRDAFIAKVTTNSVGQRVESKVVQNFAYGSKVRVKSR